MLSEPFEVQLLQIIYCCSQSDDGFNRRGSRLQPPWVVLVFDLPSTETLDDSPTFRDDLESR